MNAYANEQGTIAERPPHGSASSSHHLDFGGPSTAKHAVLPTNASNQTDLMDITEGTEQVSAQSPPPLQSEVTAADIQAIQLIRHLTATIERSDALNKRNYNELNLLQQKVEEKDQIIV